MVKWYFLPACFALGILVCWLAIVVPAGKRADAALTAANAKYLTAQGQLDASAQSVRDLAARLANQRIVSYQTLQDSYQKLVQTQTQLQQQIASLQQSLSDSEKQLQTAQADLQTMKDLSASLQTSLGQASKSLAAYKSETDKTVRNLEIQRNGWKYMAIGGAVLGIAGIIYGLVK